LGAIDEKGTHAQVCDDLDMYFIASEFDLYYDDDASVCRKPSATEPPKKTIKLVTTSQTAPSVITAPIPPPVGVTGSTTLSPAEAWDHCRRAAEFLEGLNNREANREGNPFSPLLLFPSDFFC
jgi:hypothetical protein